MANVSKKDFEASLLNGTSADPTEGSKKMMADVLHDFFGADDLVKIRNPFKKMYGWVYADHKSAEQGGTYKIEQPNEFTRRVWQGQQKSRALEPGEEIIIPGWEAYVAIVRFYKDWLGKEEASGNVAIYMNSPAKQREFINKVFVGVYDPNEPEEKKDVKAEVEHDLGLVNEKPKAK